MDEHGLRRGIMDLYARTDEADRLTQARREEAVGQLSRLQEQFADALLRKALGGKNAGKQAREIRARIAELQTDINECGIASEALMVYRKKVDGLHAQLGGLKKTHMRIERMQEKANERPEDEKDERLAEIEEYQNALHERIAGLAVWLKDLTVN